MTDKKKNPATLVKVYKPNRKGSHSGRHDPNFYGYELTVRRRPSELNWYTSEHIFFIAKVYQHNFIEWSQWHNLEDYKSNVTPINSKRTREDLINYISNESPSEQEKNHIIEELRKNVEAFESNRLELMDQLSIFTSGDEPFPKAIARHRAGSICHAAINAMLGIGKCLRLETVNDILDIQKISLSIIKDSRGKDDPDES